MSEVNVFVSYSWNVDELTKVVDEIEALCPPRNIALLRDRNEMQHGDLIVEFMDNLTGGEHIITVFSKPYFESRWCMYELLKIWQRGSFKQRTHPIIVDACDLQDANYRMDTVEYWVKEHEVLEKALEGRKPALFLEEFEKLNMLRDISQNVNKMMNFAAERLITPLLDLRAKQYVQILDQIQQVPADKPEEDICFDDDDFLIEVKENLELDLKKSDVFRQHVVANCAGAFMDDGLQNYLVEQCEAGEFVAVVQNIQSAFVDTFDEIGEQNFSGVRKLYQAAEGLVSKLVLFNVKKDWMRQYRQVCSQHSPHEHVLPNMTFGSVEVVMSREAQTIPEFQLGPHDLSLHGGRSVRLESGFKAQNFVREVIARLYKQVLRHELGSQTDEQRAIEVLQKTIQQRKQQKNLKLRKNYFLLLSDAPDSPLGDKKVQDEIKSLLPDLAFITLKSDRNEETFIVEDTDLMIAISEFFTTLEDYKPDER